ncbi:MAG: dockerin type I domain-containing protein, partial [Planctomycetota bacterium]
MRSHSLLLTRSIALTIFTSLGAGSLSASEFLRADANSDQVVSLADTHFIQSFLFRGAHPGSCSEAFDVNADERVNISDSVWILNYLYRNGPEPAAPFPEPGSSPTPSAEWLSCDEYGTGERLIDDDALLAIRSVSSPGGDESVVSVIVEVASSHHLAGFSGVISFPEGSLASYPDDPEDISGTSDGMVRPLIRIEGDDVHFGFLTTLVGSSSIDPGPRTEILEIFVCLNEGTESGEFPLTLFGAELIDFDTGRAIDTAVESATLTLDSTVTSTGCEVDPGDPGDYEYNPEPVENPGVEFRLDDIVTRPGASVSVPFYIR